MNNWDFEPHSATKIKQLPWLICKKCGLVYLNNRLTKWCIKMGCNNEDHKDYNKMLIKLSK